MFARLEGLIVIGSIIFMVVFQLFFANKLEYSCTVNQYHTYYFYTSGNVHSEYEFATDSALKGNKVEGERFISYVIPRQDNLVSGNKSEPKRYSIDKFSSTLDTSYEIYPTDDEIYCLKKSSLFNFNYWNF